MSEPKLIKNICPQCGGKLRVKKGIYYTFSTCSTCKQKYAWPKDPQDCQNAPVYMAERGGYLRRTVFENGVRLAGYSYFHDSLVPYIGKIVLTKVKPFGVDVFDTKKALICTDLSHEWFKDDPRDFSSIDYFDIKTLALRDPEGAVRLSKMSKDRMDKMRIRIQKREVK